ncbi:hypothetical protein CCACVL1_05954 [Corchorus capsularis]|uniref:Uncharacterized protein n=1 Tax=Corchorus capsularis TaxID=210143 RepID=A0A1R3JI43_COCAP|nr:hypothetical protein CCACVL1_05954 [Corchorus capsularis]
MADTEVEESRGFSAKLGKKNLETQIKEP